MVRLERDCQETSDVHTNFFHTTTTRATKFSYLGSLEVHTRRDRWSATFTRPDYFCAIIAQRENTAWGFYRTPPNDRLPGVWSSLTPYVHRREAVRIACLGVFDTVGALGIPLSYFRVANRDKYEFHNVELSSITDQNLHALAIDELRAI